MLRMSETWAVGFWASKIVKFSVVNIIRCKEHFINCNIVHIEIIRKQCMEKN